MAHPMRAAQFALFLAGFSWTFLQLPLKLNAAGFGQPFELTTVASNFAATGEFRDPFGIATGPTAHVAPVYTLILAAAVKIFKEPNRMILAMIVLNAVLLGCAAALLPVLSQCVYGAIAPGVAGGVLLAAAGWLIPQWETALSSVLFLIAALAMVRRGPVSAGLWTGACLLTNPASLPALMVLAFFRNREGVVPSGVFQGRRFALPVAGLALLVCAPWMVRNWVALGAPYFVRDNLGLELYVSNQDRSSPEQVTNWPLWHRHPNQNREEARVVASMGEGRYNSMRLRDAREWIQRHPGRFLKLSGERAWYYWFPSSREGWPAYPYWIITILGAWGAWISRRNRLVLSLALAAAAYSTTFIVLSNHLRYRFPSLWIPALFAGYGVIKIASRFGMRAGDIGCEESGPRATSV